MSSLRSCFLIAAVALGCTGDIGGEGGFPPSDPASPATPERGRPSPPVPPPSTPSTPGACGTGVGHPVLRRLNRDEYTNGLRDILWIASRPGDLLPDEGSSPEGFNTNGDYLSLSSQHLAKLLESSSAAISEALFASRAALLACPGASGSPATAACAREIVGRLGKRAFRRPLTSEELEAHTRIITDARAGGLDEETSVRFGLQSLFVSPAFLFHLLNEPAPGDPRSIYRLEDHELATRLAAFLRGSVPDPILLDLADRRQLQDPEVLRAQVKRLLAEGGGARFAESFGGQWLRVRDVLTTVNPPPTVISTFDDELRQSMKRETDALFENLVKSDLDPMELLTADYSFINARMARHYGIAGVTGTTPRRTALSGSRRKGILSHASILATTTHGERTSPIARGIFVLSQLTCNPPSVPPPGLEIDSLDELAQKFGDLTVRQQMERHRASPACAGCHAEMDPIGLAFEVFDAVGRHRTSYAANRPIDSSGALPGAGPFADHLGLIDLLSKQRRQDVQRCMTGMLMSYAVGRSMGPDDRCAVERIADGLTDGQGFSELVTRIVLSDTFRLQSGEQGGRP